MMKNNKKGFTLVELCIVIGMLCIVVVMVGTFMVTYQRNTSRIEHSQNSMEDISAAREFIKNWVQFYDIKTDQPAAGETRDTNHDYKDNVGYSISASSTSGTSTLVALKTPSSTPAVTDTLVFENEALVWKKNGTEYKKQALNDVTQIDFSFAARTTSTASTVLTCRLTFKSGSSLHTQEILVPILSQTVRQRFSSSNRAD